MQLALHDYYLIYFRSSFSHTHRPFSMWDILEFAVFNSAQAAYATLYSNKENSNRNFRKGLPHGSYLKVCNRTGGEIYCMQV